MIAIAEVSIVAIRTNRNARDHRGVKLRRIEAPLLACVVSEKFLVELSADLADHDVFRRAHVLARLGPSGEKLFKLDRREMQTVELVDRVQIDRDWKQFAVDAGEHTILVRSPLRELRQILKDFAGIGVEEMRSVPMDEQAVLVMVIVRVPANVRPPIADHDPFSQDARQPFRDDASGKARPDHEIVKHVTTRAIVERGCAGHAQIHALSGRRSS